MLVRNGEDVGVLMKEKLIYNRKDGSNLSFIRILEREKKERKSNIIPELLTSIL